MPRTRANNASSCNKNTEALGEFFKTLGAMTQMMKESMPALVTPAPEKADGGLIERFRRLAPPTFLGHGGVEKAERWKRQVEKIFEVLHCSDEQKVRLGAIMLEGDAEHRWGLVKQSWEKSGIEVTWENFLEAFNEKYFPDLVRERMDVEFIEQQQGGLFVEQYAAKFAKLSRYAPHIINTEARKGSKFERGLRPEIRERVLSANLKTFSPLVDLAIKIERDGEESRFRKDGRMVAAQFRSFGRETQPPPKRSSRGNNNQGSKKIQKTF
ncbi:uncharacterized protein LOC105421435 [Amborella trichopoda]|uniref:uncharacterized protein LOC105421435 n=1 Tax=Amborella trichopoda TaxID=13333 RepID=UPI0005D3A8BD|nr:uncharacterized protein LOC105421435 [Amborella trichopoda]|eukprot:XP_011627165.1 uncharacterized protein LOC105421435 [Amborella trichopoda]